MLELYGLMSDNNVLLEIVATKQTGIVEAPMLTTSICLNSLLRVRTFVCVKIIRKNSKSHQIYHKPQAADQHNYPIKTSIANG